MANLQKTIEKQNPIRFYHGSKLRTTFNMSTFNNAFESQKEVRVISEEDYQIALGKTKYQVLYQLNGIRVERFDRGFPIGIEYRISDDNRLHAFTTSINPMVEYKQHELLLTLIDDSIEMDIDKRNADFVDLEFEGGHREFEL